LPTPFIFGPAGGGEAAPAQLRRDFPLRGRVIDLLRDAANWLANRDPFLRALYARASLILCRTEDTRNIIPAKYRHKAVVRREIGIDASRAPPVLHKKPGGDGRSLEVLYVGRLIYWKGLHLGLEAFAQLLEQGVNAQLSVVGAGKEERWLKQRAHALGLDGRVHWAGKMNHTELLKKYANFDLFLFPSLHDSGGTVVLEAMSAGLPVICLDLGGPPTMVDASCGCVVLARESSQEEVVAGLGSALLRFAKEPVYLAACSEGAKTRARAMTWRATVAETYELISTRVLGRSAGQGAMADRVS